MTNVRVPCNWLAVAWFLVLAFLCYEGHQWFRHLVGAALCTGVGTMTFTVATTTQPCLFPTFVTLSGPLFTFGLEWSGMLLLLSAQMVHVGYALVFASFAHLRFIQTLIGRGDELLFAQQRLASPSVVLVAAAIFAIGLPPVIAAYSAVANRRRALVFAGSYLSPLPLLFAILLVSRLLYGEGGDEIRGATIFGVPVLVLAAHGIAVGLFIVLSLRLRSQSENSFR